MLSRRFTRRDFLTHSAAAAAGLFAASCTGGRPSGTFAPVRPTFGADVEDVDTRWPIKRVVYIMLENRSFDNLFGRFPGARGVTEGVDLGTERPLIHCPEWLPGDIPHDRAAFENSLRNGEMDGFALGEFGPMYAYSQFPEEDIPAYWEWAREYVLCDNFFASMGGPSYPNHLFFIAGTAGGAIDNPENIRVQRVQVDGQERIIKSWGCDAYGDDVFLLVMDDDGNVTKRDTCFEFETVGDQLTERDIDWVYYSPEPHEPGYIWNAYSAIKHIYGSEIWEEHIWPVDDLIMDAQAGSLPAVTWVVPRWQLSDHPPASTKHAHNWIVRIVNSIMRSDMWEHTAIFITWDEWGGFYDHVEPPRLEPKNHWLGFRVPTLLISPYARRGYIDDGLADFVSPLRFIADNWGLPYLTERYEQVHNFEHVFDFDQRPRPPVLGQRVEASGNAFEFPEEFEDWPDDIEPRMPTFEV
jgi:phospholipase C